MGPCSHLEMMLLIFFQSMLDTLTWYKKIEEVSFKKQNSLIYQMMPQLCTLFSLLKWWTKKHKILGSSLHSFQIHMDFKMQWIFHVQETLLSSASMQQTIIYSDRSWTLKSMTISLPKSFNQMIIIRQHNKKKKQLK